MKNVSDLSSKELAQLLADKREEERKQSLARREAYEALRSELLENLEKQVKTVCKEVRCFADFVNNESSAFREVMTEYGQLRSDEQLSFTLRDDDFKWEVKSNKVKRFDERADLAAMRLIEFLRKWIQQQPDGTENPMYQLTMKLLERNKYGDLDYKSVSKLYDLESRFSDPEYSDIMRLFKESNIVEGTAINHYFYQRDKLGVWRKMEPSFNRL